MRRVAALVVLLVSVGVIFASTASATIHPIVESFDCANEQAFAHHPYGDPAEVPGQSPGVTPGEGQNVFAALSHANESAFFGHKLNGVCGPS
jgi:hypothetical protein